jgi:MscS family membrane protein
LGARLSLSWSRDVVTVSARPLGNLAMAAVFGLGIPSLGLPLRMTSALLTGLRVFVCVMVMSLAYRAVDLYASYMRQRAQSKDGRLDDQFVPLVQRVLKILVVIIGLLFVLQSLRVDVGSLVAGLGIGGLAIALAAKDTLGNFFGSLTLFLDRPFQIGDWIVAAGVEGTVEQVGFRSTQLRTMQDSVVTVPNAKLADDKIDNLGARRQRRVKQLVTLAPSTSAAQVEAFCNGVRAVVGAHKNTVHDQTEVHLYELTDAGLQVLVHFYIARAAWGAELRTRHEVLLDIVEVARKLDISFAAPAPTLVVTPGAFLTSSPSEPSSH